MKIFKFIKSKIIIIFLKILGIQINLSANIEKFPDLKIRGYAKNIKIGKVKILGKIDLRNRENGKIIIDDGCMIEGDCRFVAAREGLIKIGKGSGIATGALINGGGNVFIGQNCILGARIAINASEHLTKKDKPIIQQGYTHRDVTIEDDCFFGANVVINKGAHIKKGSVVGAMSLVTKSTEEYSINVGIPSKKIGERES